MGDATLRHIPSGQTVLVFPSNSTSMLEIFVGFARFNTRSPLTMAGGADACVPDLVRPVPSPVRKKTTDSVRRMSSEFFGEGIGTEQESFRAFDLHTFI